MISLIYLIAFYTNEFFGLFRFSFLFLIYCALCIIRIIRETQILRQYYIQQQKRTGIAQSRKLISQHDVLFHFLLYFLRSNSCEFMNAQPFCFAARFQFTLSFCSLLLNSYIVFLVSKREFIFLSSYCIVLSLFFFVTNVKFCFS